MHLDSHSRIELGRERIAAQCNAAERDRLHQWLAEERGKDWQGQRLLRAGTTPIQRGRGAGAMTSHAAPQNTACAGRSGTRRRLLRQPRRVPRA
jgi:hypothetical protein